MSLNGTSMHSDKLTWTLCGVGTLIALYTTYWQLTDFKRRTILKPSSTRSVGVEQATEDGIPSGDLDHGIRLSTEAAIKLSTLSALARGVNPELRNAALKILCERSLKDEAFSELLTKAEAQDLNANYQALRVLYLLSNNVSPRRLAVPRVFGALVGILRRTITLSVERHHNALRCQREAISLLNRLIQLGDECQQYATDAGLTEWFKECRDAGYYNVLDHHLDQSLLELLATICRRDSTMREEVIELGWNIGRDGRGNLGFIVGDARGTLSRERDDGEDWVEVVGLERGEVERGEIVW
ncbi:hypothetical protein FPQ18DRAFT_412880 [Pyronema domesticum]|uniref:Uncharacterized protein n=1 Tax=Pyronema omphalodes (strain CBS 100304) TaxID=1076935 RepID=U4LDE1_PYROM|nr:hypothetical protein FPQ18DRAFT_412880 [Pyronema domesticum]CCX30129.1 Similar to hypothetical protein [Tuber melanosporum Mel28]; acc. no. XP_002836886 [Pyronema omphalodes CBS 100304]